MPTGLRSYRTLFAYRGVPRLVLAVLLTRLATPMLNLSLLQAVVSVRGSYAVGGLVLTGFSVALAVGVPVAGRLVDRFRPSAILLSLLAVHVLAYTGAVLAMLSAAPAAVLVGSAISLGVSTPPAAPLIRASWPSLLPAEQTTTAFALDAVLNELMVVSGLLVVAVLVAIASPIVAVITAGVCTSVGVSVLVSTSVVRTTRPAAATAADPHRFFGPLAHGQVRVLLAVTACDMLAFGCIVVGLSAVATSAGASEASGVLLAVFSAGAVISALVYGAHGQAGRPRRQLGLLYAVTMVLLGATSLASGLTVTGALVLAVGLVSGARDTLQQLVLGNATPVRHRTEAFAWMSTFMWVGNGIGTAVAGQLVARSHGHGDTTFLAAGAAAGLAALLALLLRSRLPTATEVEQHRGNRTTA